MRFEINRRCAIPAQNAEDRPVTGGLTQLGLIQPGLIQPPAVLRVFVRGPVRAEDAFGRSVLPKGRKARALLALLALAAPRPLLRSYLVSLLWSKREPSNSLGSLRQSVHE